MVWTLLLEAPTLRRTPATLAALRPVTPVTALTPWSTPETCHIRILRPSKCSPFRSSKVDPVGIMEKGYKYSHQPLTQPASSSLPPFTTYLSPFQRRNSLNPNYRPLFSFYSFSAYFYSSLLYTLVTFYYSLTTLLLLYRHSTYNYYIPFTYSPILFYYPSPLPFYLLNFYLFFSILLFIIRPIK